MNVSEAKDLLYANKDTFLSWLELNATVYEPFGTSSHSLLTIWNGVFGFELEMVNVASRNHDEYDGVQEFIFWFIIDEEPFKVLAIDNNSWGSPSLDAECIDTLAKSNKGAKGRGGICPDRDTSETKLD